MADLTLKPVISEKALAQAETAGVYNFLVPVDSNKIEIAAAVAKRFGVKVSNVTTATIKGKVKQSITQRGRRRVQGQRSTVKKAYVALAKGEKITLFEEKQ